jgi:hypothetical protein
MTECAVFRAIFFPAALVALGCFFGVTAAADGAALVPRRAEPLAMDFGVDGAVGSSGSFSRGFIWMIFRDRVGGGGSEKSAVVPLDGG